MMIAGSIDADGEWEQSESLARSIETELVLAEILDLAEEGEEAALQRRQSLVALAKGIVHHLRTHLTIELQAGDLRREGEGGKVVPPAARSFTLEAGNKITIGSGNLVSATNAGFDVPRTAKTLTGKVK